jgi:hypothetical protein
MNIRQFFSSDDNTNKDKIFQDESHKVTFQNIINKLVSMDIIDLLEYGHLLNFYKDGGTLVEMARYNQIIKKIMDNQLTDQQLKDEMMTSVRKIFSHLYNLVIDDKIDITILINNIVTHNNQLLNFTNDQKKGIHHICSFLYDPSIYTFSLRGYAGTGKTTTITKLIHYLLLNNYIKSVAFSAPTNKAVNVMKSKFRNDVNDLLVCKDILIDEDTSFTEQLDLLNEKGLVIDFLTIHKLLNYKNEFDNDGNRIFTKGDKTNIDKYDLIVIDECSMIPMQGIVNIFEDLRHFKSKQVTDNIIKKIPKIMFVGDPAQLPPVNEKISIIFGEKKNDFDFKQFKQFADQDENYFDLNPTDTVKQRFEELRSDILQHTHYTLTHVVRSSNSKVIGLCNNIREWVLGDTNEPNIGEYRGNKVKLYRRGDTDKLKTKWFNTCLEYFKNNNSSNIVLTWTNKQCNQYNQAIRKQLFKKENLAKFEIGDILILKDFYNIEETSVNYVVKSKNKQDVLKKRFYTSEQIKILGIESIIKVVPQFVEALSHKLNKMKNFSSIEDKYTQIIKIINKGLVRKYSVYKLIVTKLNSGDEDINESMDEQSIYVLQDNMNDIVTKDKELASKKIKELRNYYRSVFVDRMKIIDRDIIRPLWREWAKRFIDPFANVDYGASFSTHIAQSSTFYNVFVDMDDVLKNNNANEAKRLIYTAITRTSNEIHLLI